jgi:hypothetical protein
MDEACHSCEEKEKRIKGFGGGAKETTWKS